MNDFNTFLKKVVKLAKKKKWNDDPAWLERSSFMELAECFRAIEDGKSEEEIAEEFADLMHFVFQRMNQVTRNTDLNIAMQKKIDSNYINKKKTYKKGKIVRR